MKHYGRLAVLIGELALLGLFALYSSDASAQQRQPGDDFFRKGIQLWEADKREEAIGLFQRARALQPERADILTYLGCALQERFSMNALDTGAGIANEADTLLKEALGRDLKNVAALDCMGVLLFAAGSAGMPINQEKLSEAKRFFKRHIDLEPREKEPYYWIGVID